MTLPQGEELPPQTASVSPTAKPRRSKKLFTTESAKAAGEKGRAKRTASKTARQLVPLDEYSSLYPDIGQAAKALLPRILADEVSFRSQLMATNNYLLRVLLAAVKSKAYEVKATLPALTKEIRETIAFQVKLVDSTKQIHTPDAASRQVAGLLTRHELLQRELIRLGVMAPDGSIRLPQPPGDAIEQAPMPDHGMPGDRLTDATADATDAIVVESAEPPDATADASEPQAGGLS